MLNFIKTLCMGIKGAYTDLKPALKFMVTTGIPSIIAGVATEHFTSSSEQSTIVGILVWFTVVTFMLIYAHAKEAIECAKKHDDISFEEAWFITSIYDDDDF